MSDSEEEFDFWDIDEGWDEPLEWRWILEEKNIDPDECVLIYDTSNSPIVYVIWNFVHLRVEYLYAEILRKQTGQGTQENKKCREMSAQVRARGRKGDDCGHIVGVQHGGRMDFYNLFPQDKSINRGARLFWTIIDKCIAEALAKGNGVKIEVQYALTYNNVKLTSRPTEIHVLGRVTVGNRIRLFENIVPNYADKKKIKLRGTKITKLVKSKLIWQSGQCKAKRLQQYKRFDDSDNLGGIDANGEITTQQSSSKQNGQSHASSTSCSRNNKGSGNPSDLNDSDSDSNRESDSDSSNDSDSDSDNSSDSDSNSESDSNSSSDSDSNNSSDSDSNNSSDSDSDSNDRRYSSSNTSRKGKFSNACRVEMRPMTIPRTAFGLVPFAGATVDVVDGIEDFSEGRLLQGTANLAIGGASAAIDVVTFGTAKPVAFLMKEGTVVVSKTAVAAGISVGKNVGKIVAEGFCKKPFSWL